MAYSYDYSKLYSTFNKKRSESQKEQNDFSSLFSESVVQTIENDILFDINFTCKGRSERSKDRYISPDILFYAINSMHIYIAKEKPRETNKQTNRKGKDAENKINKKVKEYPPPPPPEVLEPTAFVAFRLQTKTAIPLDKLGKR